MVFLKVHLLAAMVMLPAALGHMHLSSPPALRSKENPASGNNIDFDIDSPLSGASAYPCKGGLNVLGAPGGAPVDTWQAGSEQSFVVSGGAAHAGGSCQVGFSEDKGETFRVVKSFIGGCPVSGKTFNFNVPASMKDGDAVFFWTWFNKVGNREIYMNCAVVTISGGGSGLTDEYPEIFKANVGNGCSTAPGKDVSFPNPGQDIETAPDAAPAPPVGSCAQQGSGGDNFRAPTLPSSAPKLTSTSIDNTNATTGPSSGSPTTSSNSSMASVLAPGLCSCKCGAGIGEFQVMLPNPLNSQISSASGNPFRSPVQTSAADYKRSATHTGRRARRHWRN